jgi:hypothetical protein
MIAREIKPLANQYLVNLHYPLCFIPCFDYIHPSLPAPCINLLFTFGECFNELPSKGVDGSRGREGEGECISKGVGEGGDGMRYD